MTLSLRFVHQAEQFEAFQLLRLIECTHASLARLGANGRPAHEPVRLGQDAELRFSFAQVTSYEPARAGAPARLALDFGLLGPHGPMPLHLTETVRARSRHRGDRTLERFLDVFHHRMSSLLYRAWAAGQPVVGLDRPGADSFAAYVGSLCGHATDGAPAPGPIEDEAKRAAAGLLCDRRRHASGLAALLCDALGAPVVIESFVGQWLRTPRAALTRFGAPDRATLGEGCVLGRRIWDRQQKFRIVIGPLGPEQIDRLQPGAAQFERVSAWARLYVGPTLDFELVLRLTREAARPMRLVAGVRLARHSWLGSTSATTAEPRLRFDGRARRASSRQLTGTEKR